MNIRPKHPALRYYGGKFRLASWIMTHFPSHEVYCEPFGGAAGVLLSKPPSSVEIYNDLDSRVINFFRVLRENRRALLDSLKYTPFSREEFNLSYTHADGVEGARRFFVQSWQGFGGPRLKKLTGWKSQKKVWHNSRANQNLEYLQAVRNLVSVSCRFKNVQIEHDDALRIILRYDSDKTLFYVDPPYPSDTRNVSWCKRAYDHEFSSADHQHLANLLKKVKAKVVLSTYPNTLYDSLFSGWNRFEKNSQTMNRTSAKELLYLNFNPNS